MSHVQYIRNLARSLWLGDLGFYRLAQLLNILGRLEAGEKEETRYDAFVPPHPAPNP